MKINIEKMEIAQARACLKDEDIFRAGIPRGTLQTIKQNRSRKTRPETIGRLAKILGVDVTEIIED